MGEPGFFQHLAGSDQTGCVETELGVLAAAGRPFARAFGMEAHPNSDQWLDAHFFCRTNSLLKLLEFLRNNDDRFIKLATEERDSNKSRIFVAVANNQTLRVLMHGKRRNQFRFTARFDVARAVDRKITLTPSLHVVRGDGGLKVPVGFHFASWRGRKPQSAFSISTPNMQVCS